MFQTHNLLIIIIIQQSGSNISLGIHPTLSLKIMTFIFQILETTKILLREELNVGTVPTFKIHNIGKVPTFKMHNIGTPKIYDLWF